MATEVLPDERALRIGRRERALAQMEAHDLDVLVLGRQANVRYFSGAPQLWVAGTRPFGPICTVVRSTGEIHLNSTWDEGMPDDIPHDHLYGLAWNPMTLIDVLKGFEGASTARRIGTDALTPSFAKLLPLAFPNAELVDGELAMRAARRVKTPEEVVALRGGMPGRPPRLVSTRYCRPGRTEVLVEQSASICELILDSSLAEDETAIVEYEFEFTDDEPDKEHLLMFVIGGNSLLQGASALVAAGVVSERVAFDDIKPLLDRLSSRGPRSPRTAPKRVGKTSAR